MQETLKKSVTICLAAMILLLSIGFVVGKHFCGGEVVKISFSEEVVSCCEGAGMPSDCCETDHEQLQHDDDLQAFFPTGFSFEQVVLNIAEYSFELGGVTNQSFQISTHCLFYLLAVPDIIVLHQSFLL